MKFRRQYADPVEDERLGRLTSVYFDPSDDRTEQHHKDEADIGLMLARLGVTPERGLPVVTVSDIVKDVTLLPDTLQEAFEILERGRAQFAQLPAGVREYFGNDPRRFAAATEDQLLAAGIPGREPEPAPAVAPPEPAPSTDPT